jgi:hypothetical protein
MPRIKKVKLRIFSPQNASSVVRYIRAPAGKQFSPSGIDNILESAVNHLDKNFPYDEFSMVQIGQAEYNFVWKGEREGYAVQPAPAEESANA